MFCPVNLSKDFHQIYSLPCVVRSYAALHGKHHSNHQNTSSLKPSERVWLLWPSWTEPCFLDVAIQNPDLIALQAIQRAENKRKMEFGGKRSSWRSHVLALDGFLHDLKLTSYFVCASASISAFKSGPFCSPPSMVKISEDTGCLSQCIYTV